MFLTLIYSFCFLLILLKDAPAHQCPALFNPFTASFLCRALCLTPLPPHFSQLVLLWRFLSPLLPLLTAEGQPAKLRPLWERLQKQLPPVSNRCMRGLTLFLDDPALSSHALILGQQGALAALEQASAEVTAAKAVQR